MRISISGEIDGTRPKDKIDKKYLETVGRIKPKLKNFLANKDYGDEVDLLFICPIIMKLPKKMVREGWHKERKLFKRKTKSADFRLNIDYDTFNKATTEEREKLLIENIISSIRILKKRF